MNVRAVVIMNMSYSCTVIKWQLQKLVKTRSSVILIYSKSTCKQQFSSSGCYSSMLTLYWFAYSRYIPGLHFSSFCWHSSMLTFHLFSLLCFYNNWKLLNYVELVWTRTTPRWTRHSLCKIHVQPSLETRLVAATQFSLPLPTSSPAYASCSPANMVNNRKFF